MALIRPTSILCNGNYWIFSRALPISYVNYSTSLNSAVSHRSKTGSWSSALNRDSHRGRASSSGSSAHSYAVIANKINLFEDANLVQVQQLLTPRLLTTQIRMLSMASKQIPNSGDPKTGSLAEEPKDEPSTLPPSEGLSTKEKLKQAVKDYGATVIVFHVTMSLASLGFFYLLVSSGMDVVAILEKIGLSGAVATSKVTEEASKFVVAYAVHKVFAPLRVGITLGVTPLIVRKLRSMGILKQAVNKPKTS